MKVKFSNNKIWPVDDNMIVNARATIGLSEVIDGNLETFLDEISEDAVGSALLEDISYRLVGFADDATLLIEVQGSVAGIINQENVTIVSAGAPAAEERTRSEGIMAE
ncbi:MAG: hypothetical protein ACYDHY_15945 [Acidiferrobacterales bacterium]